MIFNLHLAIIFDIFSFFLFSFFSFWSQNQEEIYYGYLAGLIMETTKSWICHLQTGDPREGALWFHPCLSSADFAISYTPIKNSTETWVRYCFGLFNLVFLRQK